MHSQLHLHRLPRNVKDHLTSELRRLARSKCKQPLSMSNLHIYLDQLDNLNFKRPDPNTTEDINKNALSFIKDPYIKKQLKKGLDVLKPTYIPFEDFKKNAIKLFEKVLKQVKGNNIEHVICLVQSNESTTWMMLMFLKYVRDNYPLEFQHLSKKLSLYHYDYTLNFSDLCAYSKHKTVGLCLDDACFTGSSLSTIFEHISPYVEKKFIIGAVYCSKQAKQELARVGFHSNNLITIENIQGLSNRMLKTLVHHDVMLSSIKLSGAFREKPKKVTQWMYLNSIFYHFGLYTTHRTFFEHKLPDPTSISEYLTSDLHIIIKALMKSSYFLDDNNHVYRLKLKSISPEDPPVYVLGNQYCLNKDSEEDTRYCFDQKPYSDIKIPSKPSILRKLFSR